MIVFAIFGFGAKLPRSMSPLRLYGEQRLLSFSVKSISRSCYVICRIFLDYDIVLYIDLSLAPLSFSRRDRYICSVRPVFSQRYSRFEFPAFCPASPSATEGTSASGFDTLVK